MVNNSQVEIIEEYNKKVVHLFKKGHYQEALDFAIKAHELAKVALPESHPDYSISLGNLGMIYKSIGEYQKAKEFYETNIEIRKKFVGENHPDYATSINNLGLLYTAEGNYEKAKPLFEKALQIREKSLGKESPEYADSLNDLGGIYKLLGEYSSAEEYYTRSMDIRKENPGPNSPEYANSLDNLGMLYKAEGDLKRAEHLLEEAKKIRENNLGKHHPEYAINLNNLACVYKLQNRFDEAESLYNQALQIIEQTLGKTHHIYSIIFNELSALIQSRGTSKKIQNIKIGKEEQPMIFVAMPFTEEMLDTYNFGIKNAANNTGFLCERADASSYSGHVIEWVKKRIQASDLVVADLTTANPNVYLEVGFAWGSKKPTILLIKNIEDLKFDVMMHKCIRYKHITNLQELLTLELENFKKHPENFQNSI